MIDPGEGYRLLASDEVIEPADEVNTSRGWIAAGLIGFPARCTGTYVRRSTAIRKPNENTPPQRFKWRTAMRWRFGVCVYLPSFDQWQIDTFGAHDVVRFDESPWEIIGMLLGGDVREFQWIDNDMGWPQ